MSVEYWAGRDFSGAWFDEDINVPPKKKEAEGMKKDIGMKTDKMSQETIAALHKSIAHWNDICYGMERNIGVSKCSLCGMFGNHSTSGCNDCPITTVADNCYNDLSPYGKYASIRRGFCTVDSAEAAEAMLELLVSLLPKDSRGKYNVAVDNGCASPGRNINYCLVYGRLNVSGVTGITTDGRNAFPQAKEVWRRVFEYQASEWGRFGNIRFLMPADKWVPIYGSGSIKTKDGKCVTCGQVVKRKVTKYKVVKKGKEARFHPHDWELSSDYYESVEEFNNKYDTLVASCIIPETAKEFDV